jgi:hypothetical protein
MRTTLSTLSTLSLAVSITTLLALSACKREEAAPVAPDASTIAPAATIAEPAIAAPATVAEPIGVSDAAAPGEHTTFDAKAFAGTFSDDNMTVAFAADGTYTLSSHAADNSPGTWSLEPDGHSLRLDPNAKAEADRVYTLVDNDALQAANGTQVLRRAGATR